MNPPKNVKEKNHKSGLTCWIWVVIFAIAIAIAIAIAWVESAVVVYLRKM